MAAKSTTPTLTIPGEGVTVPQAAQIVLFEKGTDAHERLRLNRPVDLKLADGTVVKATVQAVKVDALADLLYTYGPQSLHSYARAYSAAALVHSLTEDAGVDVLDVTKLYTAVTVATEHQVPVT